MRNLSLHGVLCAVLIILIFTLPSCAASEPSVTSFTAMDTLMTLTVYGDSKAADRLEDRVKALDERLSATDAKSEIARLNADGTAVLSDETAALISRSLSLCEALDGAFDITVYPAVRAWGFTTGDYTVPSDERLAELADLIDFHSVSLDGNTAALPEGAMLELGAVAKGYLADISDDILSEGGASCAILNFGGTIKLYGSKPDGTPFRVGVADPASPSSYFGYLSCPPGVIATSGGYERCFTADDGTTYIHILDPSTARPVDNGVLSVTVFTDDGVYADALSTALFVMGRDAAISYRAAHPDFSLILLTDDGALYLSDDIAADFTLSPGCGYTVRTI